MFRLCEREYKYTFSLRLDGFSYINYWEFASLFNSNSYPYNRILFRRISLHTLTDPLIVVTSIFQRLRFI